MRLPVLFLMLLVACRSNPVESVEPVEPPLLSFIEKRLANAAEGELPTIIALHGLGDTPERFSELFDGFDVPARLIAPRAPDPWGDATSWFPIDDPARAAVVLEERAALLARFAAQITKLRRVRGLPIVTGFSQGGFLSFASAAFHSERYSAALPIAGMLPLPMPTYRKARKGFVVRAFHGEGDVRVSVQDARRTLEGLRTVGTDATLTTYQGVGHGISPREAQDYMAALRDAVARAR